MKFTLKQVLEDVIKDSDKVLVTFYPKRGLNCKKYLNRYIANRKHRWTYKQDDSDFISSLKKHGINEEYCNIFKEIHQFGFVLGISEITPLGFKVVFRASNYLKKDDMSKLVEYITKNFPHLMIKSLNVEVYQINHRHPDGYESGDLGFYFVFPER